MVRRDVLLDATPEQVWRALTRSEELSAWFEADVEIDPRPRGAVRALEPGGAVRSGTVIAANAPYRLVVAWEGEERTRMEFSLEAVESGTRLTVIESSLDELGAARLLLEAVR